MKCLVCDRCKSIIKNPRRGRVITCARPLKPHAVCGNGKVPYRGNDPQQNDIIQDKEVCDDCLAELEAFFDTYEDTNPHPPEEPDNSGEGGENPDPDGNNGEDEESKGPVWGDIDD